MVWDVLEQTFAVLLFFSRKWTGATRYWFREDLLIRFGNCFDCREKHLILAKRSKEVGDWLGERFMILLKKTFKVATRVV